jgi:hypothetical protein
MIDLQKLEKSLDEALANETAESLTAWLRNKRKQSRSWKIRDEVLRLVEKWVFYKPLCIFFLFDFYVFPE